MSYLQQKILIPSQNVEEMAFLSELVKVSEGPALMMVMKRLAYLESVSESRLVDYTPQLEARPQ
mgnify:CR=1 FL=1